jgi:hypothetical protein
LHGGATPESHQLSPLGDAGHAPSGVSSIVNSEKNGVSGASSSHAFDDCGAVLLRLLLLLPRWRRGRRRNRIFAILLKLTHS